MTTSVVPTPSAPPAKGPYAHCVRAGDWLVFAGQIGLTADGTLVDGGVGAELDQIFVNLAGLLADAGVTVRDIAKATVFLADLNDYAVLNERYAAFLGDHTPARSAVQVAALPAGARVEIEVWAHAG